MLLSCHKLSRNANGVITGKRTIPQKPQFGLRWKMFELDGCEVIRLKWFMGTKLLR